MPEDTAGQVPGRWLIPTKSASCTRSYYQPSADPGHYNNEQFRMTHDRNRAAEQLKRGGGATESGSPGVPWGLLGTPKF